MKVIRSGAQIKYYHIKASDGPLAKGTLLYTSSKTSNARNEQIKQRNKNKKHCNYMYMYDELC
jgi:N-dimethylarginine dimethylaminohydrolase